MAAFTFPARGADQRGLEVLLHQNLTLLIPVRHWLDEREDCLRLVMEWPDRETALAWLDRADVRGARQRVKSSGSYYLRALGDDAALLPLALPHFLDREVGR